MKEPYIKRSPGDFITAQDWNDMQVKIRESLNNHSHNGDADQGVQLEKEENFSHLKFEDLRTEVISGIVPLYIRGTGLNNNSKRQLYIGKEKVFDSDGRGLTLTIVNKADLKIRLNKNYDTYGKTEDSNNLAKVLNAVTKDQIGILTSFDAWEAAVTDELKNAFKRIGLFKALGTTGGGRKPYAAIFEAASIEGVNTAKAVETLHSDNANSPFAEITGWFMSGSFIATGTASNSLTNNKGDLALIVNEVGEVGIGNTSPKAKLDIGYIRNGTLGAVLGRQKEGDGDGNGTFLGVKGYGTQNSQFNGKSFSIEHGFYGVINSAINFFRGSGRRGGFLTFDTFENKERMRITPEGNVGIGTENPKSKLDVKGGINAGNSDIYFTEVNHNHTGIGNEEGYAAIENSKNYDALMILGRSEFKDGKLYRRKVKLWDYLQVNGNLDVTGRFMPSFESGWIHLEKASYKEYKVAHNLKTIPSMIQIHAKSDGKNNGNKLTHVNDVRIMSFNNDSYKDSDNDRAGLSCRCINNKELVFFRNGHIWHGYEAGEFFNSGYVKFIMWR